MPAQIVPNAVFADAEVEIAAAVIALFKRAEFLDPRLVGGEIGRSADEVGTAPKEDLEDFAAGIAGGDGFFRAILGEE